MENEMAAAVVIKQEAMEQIEGSRNNSNAKMRGQRRSKLTADGRTNDGGGTDSNGGGRERRVKDYVIK